MPAAHSSQRAGLNQGHGEVRQTVRYFS